MARNLALALDCRALEKDSAPAESLLVSCASCDPDNPRAVPRAKCQKCRGKGVVRSALRSIVDQIHQSRVDQLVGGEG